MAAQLGTDLGFVDLDELWAELSEVSPLHATTTLADIAAAGPDAVLLRGGSVTMPESSSFALSETAEVDAMSLIVTRKMYDAGTILTYCPSLGDLPQGAHASMHPDDLAAQDISAGSDVTLRTDSGSITVPAVADAGVVQGSVAVELNQRDASVKQLLDSGRIVTSVRVEAAS